MRVDGGETEWTEIGFRCPRCGFSKFRKHWFSLKVPTIHTTWDKWMDVNQFYQDWNRLIRGGVINSKFPSEAFLRLRCQLTEPIYSVSLIETTSNRVLLNGKAYLRSLDDYLFAGLCPCPECNSLSGEFTFSFIIC